MADKTPLGLTRLDPAESLSADGYSFQAINPLIIDRMLRVGVYLHRHDAHERLGDPTMEPEIITAAVGGLIPSDTLIGVCYTVVDEYGGESLPSPMASVSTAPGLAEPLDVPTYEIDNTQGTLRNGTYYYVMTLTDDTGGETIAGPPLQVDIQPGSNQNAIILAGLTAIAESSEGATGWRLYKSTGASRFHFIADGPSGLDEVTDDGLLCADCLTEPPTTGHTNSTNLVQVTIPSAGVVSGATLIRVYLGLDADFTSPSLAGEFTPEEIADVDTVFTQLALETGTPPDASTTVAGAQKLNPDTDILDWPWKAPVATTADLPDGEPGDARFVLEDGTIWVYKDIEWIQYTSPPAFWKSPVPSAAELPGAGNVPGDVRAVVADYSLHIWDITLNAGAGGWRQLSPRTVPIMDEGVAVPDRGAIDFVGPAVAVTDDEANNKTVVTITGSGGGGGGSEFLAPEEGPGWRDVGAGPITARLRVDNWPTPRVIEEGLGTDDAVWTPSDPMELTGGKLVPQAAYNNQDVKLRWQGGSQAPGYGLGTAIQAIFEITSVNWTYIGVSFSRGGSSGPLEARIERAAQRLAVYDSGVEIGSYGIAEDVSFVEPQVGDLVTVTLYLQRNAVSSTGWYWYFSAQYAGLGPGVGFMDDETGFGEIDWPINVNHEPRVLARWTNPDALTVNDYAVAVMNRVHSLVLDDSTYQSPGGSVGGSAWLRGPDGYSQNDGWALPVLQPDWSYEITDRYPVGGSWDGMVWLLSGRFVKTGGVAPVEDELIGRVDFSASYSTMKPTQDYEFAVVTGDDDGRELGMLAVSKSGEIRWLAGRSTDPATKNVYVRLDGIQIPITRVTRFD